MYVLNRDDFGAVDTNGVVRFVECWERYYRGKDDLHEYFDPGLVVSANKRLDNALLAFGRFLDVYGRD